jgi:hypothetical protein
MGALNLLKVIKEYRSWVIELFESNDELKFIK